MVISQLPRLVLLTIITSIAVFAEPKEFTAKVVGISDGDTISVLHDDVSIMVKFWGIDSPESGQAFGKRAKQFTADLAFGKVVMVLVRDIDRYGRKVADIILPDGRNLNQEIVKAGYGWWFVRYAPQDESLARLEMDAKDNRRGFWRDENPVLPWEWRKGGKSLPRALVRP